MKNIRKIIETTTLTAMLTVFMTTGTQIVASASTISTASSGITQNTKNDTVNSGVPLFVDTKTDLTARPNAAIDSWYVNCAFEVDGKKLGFEWHQQVVDTEIGKVNNVEFFLMDGTNEIQYPNAYSSIGDNVNYSLSDKLEISSKFGKLTGDTNNMNLKLSSSDGSVDVTMQVKDELYNGTTGLLNFMGNSYEYAYPNLVVNGTVNIKGSEYKVKNATAWFDRQWSVKMAQTDSSVSKNRWWAPATYADFKASWLWIGMSLTDSDAISLWDCYTDKRNCFATLLHEDGTQVNTEMNVKYDDIWTSKKTGGSYPGKFTIDIPTEDLHLTFTKLSNNSEFTHDTDGIYGCQNLMAVEGKYKGKTINKTVVVELIGNLCGK